MTATDTARRIIAAAAGWLPDALLIGGATSLAYGAGLIYLPAGFIVGGLVAITGGVLLARGSK